MHTQERVISSTLTWSRVIGAATLVVALILAAIVGAQAAPLAVAGPVCADFEDLTVGDKYHPGDSFVSGPHSFEVHGLVNPADGTVLTGGFVEVEDDQDAGGSGKDLELNNTNLEVVLADPVAGITLKAGEYGGFVNLMVNGDLRTGNDLTDFHGLFIGGALVEVATPGPNLYKVRVSDGVSSFSIGGQEFFVDDVCVHPEPEEKDPEQLPVAPDLGDAPDSTNHHANMVNTAYPAVAGRFPTVWEDPGNPSGPRHDNATREAILGNFMSREAEADQGPDGDGVNNILQAGVDVANLDRFDDGWRNRNVPIADCRPTTLRVRVTKAAAATLEKMYLNVWFDGNRDGDWEDLKSCVVEDKTFTAYEWIVQDFVVDLTAIPAGGFVDINVPTLAVLVDTSGDAPGSLWARPPWMRFTLSEEKAPLNSATALADGRGPQNPLAYKWGETEDVRYRPWQLGQPGDLTVVKTVSTAGPVQPGEVFTYTVRLKHTGGDGPQLAELKDELPAGVILAGRVQVQTVAGDAGPLAVAFGDGSVRWRGALGPDAELRFDIPVRAAFCFGPEPKVIRNTVRVRPESESEIASGQPDAIEAHADVSVQCSKLTIDNFEIAAEVVDADTVQTATETPPAPHGWQPGQPVYVRFTVKNNGDATGHLAFSLNFEEIREIAAADVDTSRPRHSIYGPVVALEPGASETVIMTLNGAAGWYGCITCTVAAADVDAVDAVDTYPSGEQELVIEAQVCLVAAGEGRCPADAGEHQVRRIPLKIRWFTQDLGDAPDSTNHWGAGMTAYPAVPANYPTVFDPATGAAQGPRHFHPRPLHLGPLVSWEGEADLGPDADIVNNLRPPLNQANLDRFDDGANPPVWTLQHCQRTQVPIRVFISPALAAFFAQNQQQGYINIWIDANRDGDWADGVDCPNAEADPKYALEHVVIDFPVNVAALGAGLHTIAVNTGRVPWPAEMSEKPAWVRVTLSERVSNKTLSWGGVPNVYGDGRGYPVPFRFGETEDYLWRPANNPGGVDVEIRKRGKVFQTVDEDSGEIVSRIAWSIEYRNRGDRAAQNVVLRDQLEEGQNIIAILIGLLMPQGVTRTDEGSTLVFNIGTLEPGEHGRIVLITKVVDDVDALRNKATIRADEDVDDSNNVAVAEVKLGLRAPRILSPVDGSTCTGEIRVTGRAPANATVEIYVNGDLATTTTADANGVWDDTDIVHLVEGKAILWAVAKKNGKISEPSESVELTVNPALLWSPVSLKFIGPQGHVYQPVDEDGRLDADGWTLQLRPNTTYTVSVFVCCDDANVKVGIKDGTSNTVALTDPDGDGTFTAVFTTGPRDPDGTPLVLTVICGDGEGSGTGTLIVGDPAGPFPPSVDKPTTQRIEITDLGFVPPLLEARPGAVIEFVNMDVDPHNVTADQGAGVAIAAGESWDSGTLLPGESYKIEVTAAGTFAFSDDQNVANEAAVLVEPGGGAILLLPSVSR